MCDAQVRVENEAEEANQLSIPKSVPSEPVMQCTEVHSVSNLGALINIALI